MELCADRACARSLARQEVSGGAWRSRALTPGVVFWHVQGLSAGGAVTWSSATWEFQVRYIATSPSTAPMDPPRLQRRWLRRRRRGTNDAPSIQELHVFHGAATGIQTTAAAILTAPGRSNPRDGGHFAHDVAVGDVNGDGRADLVVAEPDYVPPPESVQSSAGRVWIFAGDREGLSNARFQGLDLESEVARPPGSHLGVDVALVDFNGDGFDDLFTTRGVGIGYAVPSGFLFTGSATGVSSQPSSSIRTIPPHEPLAYSSIRGIGDVDGDGYGDFALGVPYADIGEGGVVIFHGNPEGRLDDRLEEVPVIIGLPNLGRKVAGANFNGDAFGDVFASSYGPLSVLRGTAAGLEADSEILAPHGIARSTEGIFGGTLGVQGDLNGDGLVDLVAAGDCDPMFERVDFQCGSSVVYLFASSRAGVSARPEHFMPTNPTEGAYFRYAISPGDLNGDGVDDLVIGRPLFLSPDRPGATGALYFYYGGEWNWTRPSVRVQPDSDIQLGMWLY
ncbi:MAG: VCBS repeat-containing protein [Polyangiales bacterium]